MPEAPVIIRVGTYNLFEGGLPNLDDRDDSSGVDDSRLREQIALLASLNLDVLGLQEATWREHSTDLADFVADELGMTWRYVGRSNFYGCDLATFVRESDHLTVKGVTHLTGPPFVHGLTNVTLATHGHPRPVHVLNGHSAPSSPTTRQAEAEMVTVHRHLDVIYLADTNAAAIGDTPNTSGLDPNKVAKKLNTAPAEQLAAAGFHHIGHQDPTPTVGHDEDKLAYRCDRIHTTLPIEWITGYGVELGGDHLSDHRPTWAEITFGKTDPAR